MRKVGCLVNLTEIIVGFLGGSVMEVDLTGVVNKKGNFSFFIAIDACRVSLCFIPLYITDILCNYIIASLGSLCLSHQYYTRMVGKVVFIVYLASFLMIFPAGSVLKVDLSGTAKKKRATSVFGFKVMLGGSICVSGPFTLKISCGTISKLA